MIDLIDPDLNSMPPLEICRRIANLTHNAISLLQQGHGWAPGPIQKRLDKAGLDYLESLSLSLPHWLNCDRDGDLILAWANLGTLVECTMQLLLITFDEAYKKNPHARRDEKDRILDAEKIRFEDLRDFCNKNVWNPAPAEHAHIISFRNWNPYAYLVHSRRNAIHSIKRREIGSFDEWGQMLPVHLSFIREMFQQRMESRYPEDTYPDEDDWW